ncbi:hypothetical protein ACFFW8_15195 [Erwinia tracheiphila]
MLTEMRRSDTWLACSCVTGDAPPMNSANLRTDTGTIYLQAFSTPHDADCPMFRELKEDDDTTRSGTRKTAGSQPVSYRSSCLVKRGVRACRPDPAARMTAMTASGENAARALHGYC